FVEERTRKLTEYAEASPLNRVEYGSGTYDFGIITSSTSYQYVKEVFGDSVSVLKLGLINPLPVKIIKDFAEKAGKVYVIEELDPIIETHCKTIGVDVIGKERFSLLGEFSQKTIAEAFGLEAKETVSLDTKIPVRPPMMCAGCPHRGMFYVLAKNKITVLGDIGCYTLGSMPPLNALDMTLCMGASVSGLHGFNKAGESETENKTVCVIGDSTFMHSGVTGLINIAYNQSNSTVIVLDNSITGMTGHQQNPTTGYNIKGDPAGKVNLESLCRSVGINSVRVVDPYNLDECEKVIKEELAKNEPSVIISRRPCVLLKYVKPKKPLTVNPDKCRGCKKCMKFGCPAISFRDKHAVIDNTLCIGCGVCASLCAFNAFESEGE
ncbi:MAG: thiamine pyrophosphate-dependent enzyme, partial [Acutalibacteraceae bacterium]|nr:thiamine pyrophosphate-dependent enzyme [Acutalibacteraceae bacterium]